MNTSTDSPPSAALAVPRGDAFVQFAAHCAGCSMCKAVDREGRNLHLPCPEQARLHAAYQQERKGVRV
ncbi:hypothetical protein [Streptomyces sp. NPDC057382]|uniref:hypothetical protein n=1 Tax=unclassified Streptomyces TaxID=2593676 RepID=UPI00363D6B75